LSGAGAGKGLLVRAVCAIAFGIRPCAFTARHDRQELEKRIPADLIKATPALFLDNVNGAVLRLDMLAILFASGSEAREAQSALLAYLPRASIA